jgi:ABC-type bacteriocin/lantibiotic exporter with double-glycine peptidase domain
VECLYASLRVLGKEPDYQRLLADAATDERGTSVAGLIKAAQRQGCYAIGLRAGREELCDLLASADQSLIAICHQEPDHFVVWFHNRNGKFTLLDPSYQHPNNVANETDLEAYSGAVVLLANEPIRYDRLEGTGSWWLPHSLQIAALLVALVVGVLGGRYLGTCRPSQSQAGPADKETNRGQMA